MISFTCGVGITLQVQQGAQRTVALGGVTPPPS